MRRMQPAGARLLVVSLFMALFPSPASAAPGDLDATFNDDGWTAVDFGGFDWGEDVAIQPDGKIVVVGWTDAGGSADFAVARYNTDGSLDGTFGDAGKLTTDISGAKDRAFGVAIQSDGAIVVAGSAWDGPEARQAFALVRYTADGAVDTTFGNGVVKTNFTSRADWATAVAIQGDGKIIAAGGINVPGDFAVARYNSDGTLDSSFSGDGRRRVDFSARWEFAESLGIQRNGKIVVSGFSQDRLAVARFLIDGRLDSTFSRNGKTVLDRVFEGSGFGLALQPDGKIVVAGGTSSRQGIVFLLVRYKRDGYRDRTFSKDGIRRIDIHGPYADASERDLGVDVAIQPDGKIVEVGVTGDAASGHQWVGLARVRTGGRSDASFGGNGQVVTRFEGLDWAKTVALQSDGKIVVAGTAMNLSLSGDFLVARYLG